MKLQPEIIRFAFLMNKIPLEEEPDSLNLAELFEKMNGYAVALSDDIDFKISSLREGVNPKIFAEDCAALARWALAMADNVGQLPVTRHGLIEAINDHLP